MNIFIFNIDFVAKFSNANMRAIAANIAGIAAFCAFAACFFAFDALFYATTAVFVAFAAVALTSEFASATAEAGIWCCNSVVRVLRCQRRSRGFNSPQHRHGIGRPAARTLVCETEDMGSIPIPSPISGRSSAAERSFWKRETGRAARPAQTTYREIVGSHCIRPKFEMSIFEGIVGAHCMRPPQRETSQREYGSVGE